MKTPDSRTDEAREKELIDYLRAHPDFFIRHTHLLVELAVPHASGGAVSLIERQVGVLRDQNHQLRRELAELIQIARENDRLSERMQRLTLALMESAGLSDILLILEKILHKDFNADATTLRLFVPSQRVLAEHPELLGTVFVDCQTEGLASFKGILDAGRPVCERLTSGQLHYLFADQAGVIASTALVPLAEQGGLCPGLLAIGSRDSQRFHSEMGTVFLAYMGALISRALKPYLGI